MKCSTTPEELAFFRLVKDRNNYIRGTSKMDSIEIQIDPCTLKALNRKKKDLGVSMDDLVTGVLLIAIAKYDLEGSLLTT